MCVERELEKKLRNKLQRIWTGGWSLPLLGLLTEPKVFGLAECRRRLFLCMDAVM